MTKKHRCYGCQRLDWPWHEPVNATVVDKPREVTASRTQGLAHRRHRQDDVEVVGALIDEVLPNALAGRRAASVRGLRPHLTDNGFLLVVGKERRYYARRQHVVDQLEEALLGDVLIGEQEHGLLPLNTQPVVQDLEVIAEAGLIVATAQLDLKDLTAGGEGGQTGQALLATTTC